MENNLGKSPESTQLLNVKMINGLQETNWSIKYQALKNNLILGDNTKAIIKRVEAQIDNDKMISRFREHFYYWWNYVYFLPASIGHHDQDEYGIIKHTIATLDYTIDNIRKQDHRDDGRHNYSEFLTALYHDIGKIYEWEITNDTGETWNHRVPLVDFCIDKSVITAAKDTGVSFEDSNAMSLYMLSNNLEDYELDFLGPKVITTAYHTFMNNKNAPRQRNVTDADTKAARDSVGQQPLNDLALVTEFAMALKDLVGKDIIKVNVHFKASIYLFNDELYVPWPTTYSLIENATKDFKWKPNWVFINTAKDTNILVLEGNDHYWSSDIIVNNLNNPKKNENHLNCIRLNKKFLDSYQLVEYLSSFYNDIINPVVSIDNVIIKAGERENATSQLDNKPTAIKIPESAPNWKHDVKRRKIN